MYDNVLYECNVASATGVWDGAKWERTTISNVLDGKADIDGNYQTLTAGLANNLDSRLVLNDVRAYSYRTMDGGDEVGSPCKVNSITGGTIFWNQICSNGDFSNGTTGWSLSSITGTVSDGVLAVTDSTNPYASIAHVMTKA